MELRRALSGVGLITSSCLLAAAMRQSRDSFDVHVVDASTVKVADVCAATPNDIQCWSPSGEHDYAMTERVSAHFLVENGGMLPLRYKSRSMLIVLDWTVDNPVRNAFLRWGPGGGMRSPEPREEVLAYDREHRDRLDAFWIYPREGESTFTPTFDVEYDGEPVVLQLRRGAEAKVGEETYRIVEIEPSKPSKGDLPEAAPGPSWDVKWLRTGALRLPQDVRISTRSKSGGWIQDVDEHGYPIPYDYRNAYRRRLQYGVARPIADGVRLWVKPSFVESLSIAPRLHQTVVFPPVQLSPKP